MEEQQPASSNMAMIQIIAGSEAHNKTV